MMRIPNAFQFAGVGGTTSHVDLYPCISIPIGNIVFDNKAAVLNAFVIGVAIFMHVIIFDTAWLKIV